MPRTLSQEQKDETVRIVNESSTRSEAAQKLGISLPTLYLRIRNLNGIKPVKGGRPLGSTNKKTKTTPKPRKRTDAHLWEAYWKDRSIENRNKIAEFYKEWATGVVINQLRNVPNLVDMDAAIQAGQIAILETIPRYDGSTLFTSYAARRVAGAALDELRASDHVPRLTRTREKQRKALEEAGVNAEEVMGTKKYQDSITKNNLSTETVTNADSDHSKAQTIGDQLASHDQMTEYERGENFRYICRGCTLDEQTILFLYYYKGKKMKKIGEVLNLSESRVSQMHSMILERLVESGIDQRTTC